MLSVLENHRPEEDLPQLPRAVREPPVRAPLDAPSHLPDSAPQSRYHTRRASATSVAPPQIPPRSPPTKKAKTSEPGESSRAPRDSQSQPSSARRPRPSLPIEGNSDCRSRDFHVEAYFDHSLMRQQPELRDSYRLLERYHLIPFMTLPQFFYPRVALDFYQSMTTRGVPTDCHAFHIPFAPADPATFRRWAPLSEWDMVRILSRGTSSQRTILRRELPPEMLLVDVVLRANLFPLQHKVQRRGAIMEALFRISEGYYFGPHHLIMAALLHFEEKVHTRRLARADSMPLLFPRLLCHVLAHMGFPATLVQSPAAIVERASLLTNGLRYGSIASPRTSRAKGKPPITIPGPEYRALLASFQTLTTTQTAIMERMDHFQLQQDQQTLILREIQHHLGLSPPAPPVAVPSTVAAEDPSYPPEEPTT
ncbi:hypothetical protein CK203_032265 [Vitis vinifera]|uniref:Uncharacterized protein n=1 Tax=Vitis vinifera TaxID=29760 RepID=A0A438IJQ3_VITVI|nr:hypothetical protein CK203_032265 [Vitis vinifera]